MTDPNWAEYDLDDMGDEEKNELIFQLAEAYNTQLTISGSLLHTLDTLADELTDNNVKGQRKKAMLLAAYKMNMIADLTLESMGVDVEQSRIDLEFQAMMANLTDPEAEEPAEEE